MIQFLRWCNKCPFKGKTQGDLQRHILWIHEGKGPQCGLCDYRPTQKLVMKKHIELIHGNKLNTKNRLSVFALSVDIPLPPNQDFTNTLNVMWEAFQLWTLLKHVYPEIFDSAAPENSRRWNIKGCQLCEKAFIIGSALKRHALQGHKVIIRNRSKVRIGL